MYTHGPWQPRCIMPCMRTAQRSIVRCKAVENAAKSRLEDVEMAPPDPILGMKTDNDGCLRLYTGLGVLWVDLPPSTMPLSHQHLNRRLRGIPRRHRPYQAQPRCWRIPYRRGAALCPQRRPQGVVGLFRCYKQQHTTTNTGTYPNVCTMAHTPLHAPCCTYTGGKAHAGAW